MLPQKTLQLLRNTIKGRVILPGDQDYNDTRKIWNAMIDKSPAVIVRPAGAEDVGAAIIFACDNELEIAIKGGGHNVAGNAVCDNGLMLDLSCMKSIQVTPSARTARVQAGALLQDLDRETQNYGLATPAGFVSTTGLAGLTLGGGVGYLSRKYGLTIDNLQSVELVTADGNRVRASTDENPELFWGLRGGGGNFGVVTSFDYELHKQGPQVLAGPVAWPFEEAPTVLREIVDMIRTMPDEVSCLPIIRRAPPAPFLPENVHGKMVLVVAMIYAGDPEIGQTALAPLRRIGQPIADAVATKPYTQFQSMFDAATGAGARNYWKSHFFNELSGEVVDCLCEHAAQITSAESSIGMLSLGGEITRRASANTAYAHRQANWVVNIQSRWRDAEDDERHISWARKLFEALAPHATGGFYVNFITGDEHTDTMRATYSDKIYDRLGRLKADWDPHNVFHLNHNIAPAR